MSPARPDRPRDALDADDASTLEPSGPPRPVAAHDEVRGPALVVAWLEGAPELVGAVLRPGREPAILGRGAGDGDERRVTPVRQAPGEEVALAPPRAPWMSRRQLRLQALDDTRLLVENLGRAQLRVRGAPCGQAILHADRPGELMTLGDHALFVATRRPTRLTTCNHWTRPLQPLGDPDAVGLVGESPAAWALRERVAFVARQRGHVLVVGPSGAGKELVAQAMHALSPRAGERLVARNAATIPHALMDVELFGHVANYPNPGMRERPGLVGEADRGTLFLDELGELPEELQAHLLRVMDSGEHQRLGDPRSRRVDVRLVAATNRDPESLKPDLRARFRHLVVVPPLDARRDDVPLIARHLLRLALHEDPSLGQRLFDGSEPRLDVDLMAALLVHPLPLQVRELEALLWDAIAASTGERVRLGPLLEAGAFEPAGATPPAELTAEAIAAALERHEGHLERVWRDLGLKNRYVLRRLIAKHGLRVPER